MRSACPSKVVTVLPVATSQRRIVLSTPAEATALPSGLNATEWTVLACPFSVAVILPPATSQSCTLFSGPSEARDLPSGLKATQRK